MNEWRVATTKENIQINTWKIGTSEEDSEFESDDTDQLLDHSGTESTYLPFWTCISKMKISKVLLADLQILGSAFCFGIGFLGQRAVMVHGLGPMTCNAFRFGLSTILLVAVLPILPPDGPSEGDGEDEDDLDDKKSNPKQGDSGMVLTKLLGSYASYIAVAKKTVWYWGLLLGLINFLGSGFLQWGISKTTASKCAFIAGFDLFLTPIFSLFIPTFKARPRSFLCFSSFPCFNFCLAISSNIMSTAETNCRWPNIKNLPLSLFWHSVSPLLADAQLNARPSTSTWIGVVLSLVGLFLLSGVTIDDFEMGMGETLTLISTVFWTLHITYVQNTATFCPLFSFHSEFECVDIVHSCLFIAPSLAVVAHSLLYRWLDLVCDPSTIFATWSRSYFIFSSPLFSAWQLYRSCNELLWYHVDDVCSTW